MEHLLGRGAVVIVAAGVTMVGGYLGLVTGAVPVDLGWVAGPDRSAP